MPTLKLSSARLITALVVGAITGAPALRAHGDDQLLIQALTEELAKTPDADLFIRRGELFRHHQEWSKAEADFVSAAKLDPSLTIVDFFRARVALESGAPERAQALIDRYQKTAPDEPEGWFLRGEIAQAAGRAADAASHFAEGIRRSARPRPEHFLRHARLLAAASPTDRAAVIAALDAGIAQLGPVISLVDFAIELELESGDFAGALARIDRAMTNLPRRERWLVRRGDILVKAGRTAEATTAYRAALSAIEDLPERHRDTVPMEKLAADVRSSLQRLSSH